MSTIKNPAGPTWPLGFVQVTAIGTPVCLTHVIDANNNNAPWASPTWGVNSGTATGSEYTPRCKSIWLGGFQPASANNGMIPNTGQIYVNYNPGANNANQNRSDPGSMVAIVQPGTWVPIPASLADPDTQFSPYLYSLDGDNNNDGCLVVLIGGRGQ